jgi:CHAT domain-containing protein
MAPVFEEAPSHAKAVYAAATDKVRRSRNIGGEEFAPLKESEHEATSIAAIFRTNGQRADLLLRDSAQESVIKAPSVGSYGFLHIATHALINEDKPAFSGIVFAAPGKSSAEDGVLYCGEAYNLRLNADLVVLSACETGLGTLAKGEGILGLTRGFLYAGAKNIVVSLWQVGDKSTSDLMVEFYRNILKGEKYSTALRDAKLSLVTHGRYAHPIEWAPFVLTGR